MDLLYSVKLRHDSAAIGGRPTLAEARKLRLQAIAVHPEDLCEEDFEITPMISIRPVLVLIGTGLLIWLVRRAYAARY